MSSKYLSLLTILLATFSASAEGIKTPFLAGWDQTPPKQFERQAKQYPDTFYLQGDAGRKAIAFTYDDGPAPTRLSFYKC